MPRPLLLPVDFPLMRPSPRQIWVLVAGVFLLMTGITLVAPILPLYAREFGVSRTAAGGLISAFAGARLGFDLVGGVAADRVGARRVMVWAALLVTATSVGAALAPNYLVLLVTRVGEGIGSAAFATAAMQLIVITTPKDRLGRTMALYQTGLIGGIAVGPVIGGYAAQLGDFSTPFWIYAGLGLLVAALAWFFVAGAAPAGRTFAETYRAAGGLLSSPAFLGLLFVSFSLFIMRAGARITLIPLYAGEELGLSESEIGGVLAVSALVNLVIVNPGGWLVDRLGRRPVLITGLVLTGIATALYGEMTTFASLLWLSIAFGGAAALASIPPPTLAGDLAPPGAEGASVGLYRTAGDLGFVIGPLLLGAVAENGAFETGFFLSGGLLLVAALVAVGIGETRRRREPAVPVEAP